MRCKECGEQAQNPTLRFCENCGAKMPELPPGAVVRTGTGRVRSTAAARALPARDEAEDTDPGLRPVRALGDGDEHTDPGRPAKPPYEGPVWLAHVPGHSPSMAGLGLLAVALVLSLLPFFAGVGAFWSMAVLAGGWLVAARELNEAGERHPLVDWIPPSLQHPAVPAVYTVVVAALAVRMLGLGLTPLLWLGGAGLLGYDQYRKVYAGPGGWSRLFEPRELLSGLTPVALGGVAVCLVSLFLTWVPVRAMTSQYSAPVPVPGGPPELRVVDTPRPADDAIYSLFNEVYDKGWDQPLAVFVALLLLGALAVLALRPEAQRPEWLRFAPAGAVAASLLWGLVNVRVLPGPLLFLAGLGAVGLVAVQRALARDEAG